MTDPFHSPKMPNTYQIFPEKNLIIETFHGPVTMEDFMELVHSLWDDPSYGRTMDLIVDLSDARLNMPPKQLGEFADQFIQSEKSLIGRAAVVADTPLETALTLLLKEKMSELQPVGVFSTMAAAMEYLNK